MYDLIHVSGDTYYIDAGSLSLPLFKIDSTQAILFDSGLAHVHGEGLLKFFDKTNLKVRAILTSHAHIDHTGNHDLLQKKFGARVYMSLFNAAVSENPLALKAYFYGSSYRDMIKATSSMCCRVDHIIRPNQPTVEVDGILFHVLDLAGHSPEHIGFVTPDNVAYLADLFMSRETVESIRLPYSMCCQFDFKSKQKSLVYDYDFYILAHKGVYADIATIANINQKMWNEKIERIELIADRPRSLGSYVKEVLSVFDINIKNTFNAVVAERSVRAILHYLVDNDRLSYSFKSGEQIFFRNSEKIVI
jgi:glyoxylase-like metal-dependent hydrolase (beta-lactamase superfamily II)